MVVPGVNAPVALATRTTGVAVTVTVGEMILPVPSSTMTCVLSTLSPLETSIADTPI